VLWDRVTSGGIRAREAEAGMPEAPARTVLSFHVTGDHQIDSPSKPEEPEVGAATLDGVLPRTTLSNRVSRHRRS